MVDDFEPPKYYGQPMIDDENIERIKETIKNMGLGRGVEESKISELMSLSSMFNPKIKPDKNRSYREGEYH